MSSQLLLVCHGPDEWSDEARLTGLSDVPLDPEGRGIADRIAGSLGGWKIERAYASPAMRAAETAERSGFGVAEIDPMLVERNFGALEGHRPADLRRREPEWSAWTHDLPDGETVDQVGARADAFIARFEREVPNQNAIAFGHRHQIAVLIARWCGLPASDGCRFPIALSTISLIGRQDADRVVRLLNHPIGVQVPKPDRRSR